MCILYIYKCIDIIIYQLVQFPKVNNVHYLYIVYINIMRDYVFFIPIAMFLCKRYFACVKPPDIVVVFCLFSGHNADVK